MFGRSVQHAVRFAKSILVVVLVSAALFVDRPAPVEAQAVDLCGSTSTEQFSDVDSADYAAAYILCMKTLGMSFGRSDGGYGPAVELTRAQMASFLVRLWRDVLDGQCPGGGAPFTDVPATNPHAGNIGCLYNLGITQGVTPTTYGPESKLKASQISRFLLRTYEKLGNTCQTRESELDEAVSCLEALNVLPSTAEGLSDESVTRAQMAVYVVGLWHNISGRGLPPIPPPLGSASSVEETAATGLRGSAPLVIEILEELVVNPEQRSGYDRKLFDHWSDLDGDGCDTRREVLLRDSRVEAVLDPNRTCWVVSGLWYSYYDDEWVQGPSSLDIDHLVPLAEAWDSGAHSWSDDRREAFANDEGALVAVTSKSNRSKGAADPAEWMPPNGDFECPYVAAWIATKARWSLSVDQREAAFLQGLLNSGCQGTTLNIEMPILGFPVLRVPDLGTPALGTPGGSTGTDPQGVPPNPGNSKNCSDFSTQAEAQEWFDTYFPHYGDVARLDRDGDGEACESLP